MLDALVTADFGDMYQAIDAFFKCDKGTELGQAGDFAGMGGAMWVFCLNLAPGIGKGVAQAEGKFLVLPVALFDSNFELLAD